MAPALTDPASSTMFIFILNANALSQLVMLLAGIFWIVGDSLNMHALLVRPPSDVQLGLFDH